MEQDDLQKGSGTAVHLCFQICELSAGVVPVDRSGVLEPIPSKSLQGVR